MSLGRYFDGKRLRFKFCCYLFGFEKEETRIVAGI